MSSHNLTNEDGLYNVPNYKELLNNRSEECDILLNQTWQSENQLPDPHCRGTFDSWTCWNDTPAGQVAYQPCPYFISGFEPNRIAFKKCNEDGTWFVNNFTGKPWTNYTTCVNLDDLSWQIQVNTVFKTGYTISLVALIVSLALFSYFRNLRCARIVLHMNLFISFAINNSLWLFWYSLIEEPEILAKNWIGCQITHVVLHYFMITNYTWMLCEGLYLHTILVSAFISESSLLVGLHLLGWGVPLLFVLPYTFIRASVTDGTIKCWSEESPYRNIMMAPVIGSIILNLLFLCNIVRVLLTKLRAGPHVQQANRPSNAALQALRATLLLVPLLGLNFLVTPCRPDKGSPFEKTYDILAAITSSFQGLCVTILFCFCNNEVISQVKRRWKNAMFRPRANSCTATTVSVCQYVAGEDKISLNKASSKKIQRNSSSHRHFLRKSENGDKVNV